MAPFVAIIHRKLTHGKKQITVKFLAHPRNTAGGLFGLRTIRAG